MGDRANVCVIGEDVEKIFFYTHWCGSELPQTVADALSRGRMRWGDHTYLARIIFSEMIKDAVLKDTGYGIGTAPGDNGGREHILVVDMGTCFVGIATEEEPTTMIKAVTYEAFIKRPGILDWS